METWRKMLVGFCLAMAVASAILFAFLELRSQRAQAVEERRVEAVVHQALP